MIDPTTTRDCVADNRRASAKSAKDRQRFLDAQQRDHDERTRLNTLIRPTRETEAKLKPDSIRLLFKSGRLSTDQVAAAREIDRVWSAVCAGMFSKAVAFGSSGGKSDGPSWRAARAYTDRYKPWADALSGIDHKRPSFEELRRIFRHVDADQFAKIYLNATGTSKPPAYSLPPVALEVVVDIAVDGITCGEIDRTHHWRNGRAADLLASGLWLYVHMAGGHIPLEGDDLDLATSRR